MSPELIYFIKINTALVIFYAFYRLFFYKDTFFSLRRFLLLGFFMLAFMYPLMNIHEWMQKQEPIAEVILLYSAFIPEPVAETPAVTTSFTWKEWTTWTAKSIYLAGVGLLFIRFFIQLGSIIWIKKRARREIINHAEILILNKPAGPFSFFRWIFLHPESHTEDEIPEILTHELTHARQWHSIDVIISEIICIFCWVNPFIWLLKREVRHNLEYLADNNVLRSGYDSRRYQYHLLGLAHHQGGNSIYNNFNVLHLKNRIRMMNQERTNGIVRTKYLLFIPLVAILLLISNIESLGRITKELTATILPENTREEEIVVTGAIVNRNGQPIAGASIISESSPESTVSDINGKFTLNSPLHSNLWVSYPGMEKTKLEVTQLLRNPIQLTLKSLNEESNQEIFTVVEEMPEFPGGDQALFAFLGKNIKYPVIAQENGIQGRVVCTFTVNSDGSITQAEVVRGIDPALDKEAIRIIEQMPAWKPGKQRGEKVRVRYTLPIVFRLA